MNTFMSIWFCVAGKLVYVTETIFHYSYYCSTKDVFKGDFQKADLVT